jgi:hypothetical protein
MNAARELLYDLAEIGATIKTAGDRLILRAGSAAIPADLIARIRQTKAELLDTLSVAPSNDGWTAEDWRVFYNERAGSFEFDGELPRAPAEAQAFEACIIEWLNRNPAPSLPGRCAWCSRCERSSDAVVPFGTEPGTHAWLHWECWRPWQEARRGEAEMALSQIGGLSNAPQSERT